MDDTRECTFQPVVNALPREFMSAQVYLDSNPAHERLYHEGKTGPSSLWTCEQSNPEVSPISIASGTREVCAVHCAVLFSSFHIRANSTKILKPMNLLVSAFVRPRRIELRREANAYLYATTGHCNRSVIERPIVFGPSQPKRFVLSDMAVPGGEKFGRGEKLFGQISKPSLVPNISFNFKDSLCHIEPEGAITTPFFFHYDMHTLMLQFY